MMKSLQDLGLCVTCRHMETCINRSDERKKILSCEEFDTGDAPLSLPRAAATPSQDPDLEPLVGLCSNCLNQKGCSLSSQDGGVWHCEEYL
jgi:hypothetical protein